MHLQRASCAQQCQQQPRQQQRFLLPAQSQQRLHRRQQQQQLMQPAQLQRQQHAQAAPAALPLRSSHRHVARAGAAAVGAPAERAAAHTAADPCLQLTGLDSRAVGALVGSMAGNALGAQVEPEKHYRVSRMFPDGPADMSWSFGISPNPLPAGRVTGDYVIMTAVGQSLVHSKAADVLDIAACMAYSYVEDAPDHWYSPYNKLVLEGLAAGSNPFLLAERADGYLASTPSRAANTASHRPDRQMHGVTDFCALNRAIPVALAYRQAPLEVLRQAVDAAVRLTHPSDDAADAASVLAAAVAWCLRVAPDSASPEQLLQHLQSDVATTHNMREKLELLQQRLPALQGLGHISSWSEFWRSKAWSDVTGVANQLSKQNLAVEATQAAALALWVLLVNWQHPQQAVMMAVGLGGYAATTGTLVGGLAGALHGSSWVPQQWWECLQDEPQQPGAEQQAKQGEGEGEEEEEVQQAAADADSDQEEGRTLRPVSRVSVVALGHELAALDCRQPLNLM